MRNSRDSRDSPRGSDAISILEGNSSKSVGSRGLSYRNGDKDSEGEGRDTFEEHASHSNRMKNRFGR